MKKNLGLMAGLEALKSRQSLAPLFTAAFAARNSQVGAEMIGGLLAVVAMAIDACAKSGHPLVKAQNERAQAIIDAQPSARRLYLTALCQGNFDQEGADVLAGVLGVLYVARNVFQVSDPKVENEETAPPVMKVEIVGMPTRATETVIERDEDLEIASTRTVERDAA